MSERVGLGEGLVMVMEGIKLGLGVKRRNRVKRGRGTG